MAGGLGSLGEGGRRISGPERGCPGYPRPACQRPITRSGRRLAGFQHRHGAAERIDFEAQAAFVRAKLARYNCTFLGVDATGVGAGVYQLLAKAGPNGESPVRGLRKIEYSVEVKAEMVMKAQHTFSRQRIAYDAGWIDIVSSFLSIKKTLTTSGRSITFKAGRAGKKGSTGDVGHADIAWATMHILINEPLDGRPKAQSTMEIM